MHVWQGAASIELEFELEILSTTPCFVSMSIIVIVTTIRNLVSWGGRIVHRFFFVKFIFYFSFFIYLFLCLFIDTEEETRVTCLFVSLIVCRLPLTSSLSLSLPVSVCLPFNLLCVFLFNCIFSNIYKLFFNAIHCLPCAYSLEKQNNSMQISGNCCCLTWRNY